MTFEWGRRTYVMGILNVTPDSFSGDGLLAEGDIAARAVAQAQAFTAAGADIIDIGGESTRPGSTPVELEEELARVLPVITAVRAAVDATISVDTYRAAVAAAALDAGAAWVNDVWGLRMDPELAGLIARRGCPVVLMHNRSRPKDVAQAERLGGRYVGVEYADLLADVRRELQEQALTWRWRPACGRRTNHHRPRHRLRQDGGAKSGTDRPAGRLQGAGLPAAAGAFAQVVYWVHLRFAA
jgi:dihydropteroate synthase